MSNKTIYDRYYEMVTDWRKDSDVDKLADHLPILVAAEHLANQIRIETTD